MQTGAKTWIIRSYDLGSAFNFRGNLNPLSVAGPLSLGRASGLGGMKFVDHRSVIWQASVYSLFFFFPFNNNVLNDDRATLDDCVRQRA